MEKELMLPDSLFSEDQIQFMSEQNIDRTDILKAVDGLDHLLRTKGFDIDYNPTKTGKMCEDILDIIGDYDN